MSERAYLPEAAQNSLEDLAGDHLRGRIFEVSVVHKGKG